MLKRIAITVFVLCCLMCAARAEVTVGAARTAEYLPMLRGKRVALVCNHTSVVDSVHTLDMLLNAGIDVRLILSPEHGFRGTAAEGQTVDDSVDPATSIPIFSLYGKKKGAARLAELPDDIDVIVFDIQDVGMRFYTYYINMIETMEWARSHNREYVVLDRPNPWGMKVDGPILDMKLRSGVGRLPVPVIHGMTLGELARMAVGEGWLEGKAGTDSLRLKIVTCTGYTHSTRYKLPVWPSPNLRSMQAIYLYPSLCLFEGTVMSVGRGTDSPFTIFGHPNMTTADSTYTPTRFVAAGKALFSGRKCVGVDLSNIASEVLIARGLNLQYVIDAYRNKGMRRHSKEFFKPFFNLLIGNRRVRAMIESGCTAKEIHDTWREDVEQFKERRKQYLLYPL